jgi:predicted permease
MNWFTQLFRRGQIYGDLAEEIEEHLAEKVDALVAGGMDRKQAEHKARREFGNVTRIEEQGREAWMWPKIEGLLEDIRFAFRRLNRSPGFALTAIATLALGIGANVIVFSVLNGVILRPLPVPSPEQIFQLTRGKDASDYHSYLDYADLRDRDKSMDGLIAYGALTAGLTIDNATAESWGYTASANYFDVLGIKPAQGRFFHSTDEKGLASAPYIVLSNDFWHRQFGASESMLGKTILLNQHPFTIIGVAPADFRGTEVFFWADYWIPIVNAEQVTGWSDLCCRDHIGVQLMGRLKPGVTPREATDSFNAIATQMAKENAKDDGLTIQLRQPGPAGNKTDPTRFALAGIMLLAFMVLLAACANLATIFTARAADRSSELAVRLAIGASRWTVLRQLLVEAVIVSIIGGLVGSALSRLLLGFLAHWQPFGGFPTRMPILPDSRVYLLAIALSVCSGIFFGLLPARQVWRTEVVQAIKSGYVFSDSNRRFALRDVLLVIQIVVCTVLVTASLVAVRGMVRAMHVPLGFDPQGVTLVGADLRMAGYSGAQALPIQKKMLDAATAIPGATAVALSDSAPFANNSGNWFIYRWGTSEFQPSHMAFSALNFSVSPGYLALAKIPLIVGRDFTWHDDQKSPQVAIVNKTFARKLFGTDSAVGQRFAMWETAKYEIVGVVDDGQYGWLDQEPHPIMFLPLAQGVGGTVMSQYTIVSVRSQLPPDQISKALQQALTGIEPRVPVTIRPWSNSVDRALIPARTAAVALGVLGLLAAVLAITGIFGMAAYTVSRRMREQAIRMALGAQRFHVMRSTLTRPALILLCGSAIGIAGGLLTGRILAHIVSFATPSDPLVLGAVLLTMTLLGLIATWIPARRALAVDPSQLLRES